MFRAISSKAPRSSKARRAPPTLFVAEYVRPWYQEHGKPWITYILIALNCALFAYMCVACKSWGLGFKPTETIVYGANWPALTLSNEPWRLLTSCFMHINWLHIGMNMLALLTVGAMCERLFGRWRMLSIYLITGLFASVASILYSLITATICSYMKVPATVASALGASGAICGLIGAYFAVLFLHRADLPNGTYKRMTREIGGFLFYLVILGIPMHLDQGAHLGGLLSGFALGYFCLPKLEQLAFNKQDLMAMAATIFIGVSLFAIESSGILDPAHALEIASSAYLAFQDDYSGASAKLENLLKIQPKNKTAASLLSVCYFKMQKLELAYDESLATLSMGKPSAQDYLLHASMCRRVRKFPEAVQAAETALKIAPGNLSAKKEVAYGKIYRGWQKGNFLEAMSGAEQLFAIVPEAKDKAYSAIWYAIAAKRCHNSNWNMLLTKSTYFPKPKWTDSLVDFEQGKISAPELLKLAKDDDQLTEAHAYIAFDAIDSKHLAEAKSHLNWVLVHGNKDFFEYDLSDMELARLK